MRTSRPWSPAKSGEAALQKRKAATIEVVFQRKDDPMHVCVVTHAGHQAGLTQIRQRVTQLRQPPPEVDRTESVACSDVM